MNACLQAQDICLGESESWRQNAQAQSWPRFNLHVRFWLFLGLHLPKGMALSGRLAGRGAVTGVEDPWSTLSFHPQRPTSATSTAWPWDMPSTTALAASWMVLPAAGVARDSAWLAAAL